MKINSSTLIHADQQIDRYGIGLSTLSNLVIIVLKIGIAFQRWTDSDRLDTLRNASPDTKHFWEYVENKQLIDCASHLIPGLGQFLLYLRSSDDVSYANTAMAACRNDGMTALNNFNKKTLFETPAFALFAIQQNSAYFNRVSVALLYDRTFLAEALNIDETLMQNARYLSLEESYRKSCEIEATDKVFNQYAQDRWQALEGGAPH